MPTKNDLKILQALDLDLKIALTQQRIGEWVKEYGIDGVYVSFSGGKDSTVLLDIVRKMYGNRVEAVFVNTGLEYPEVRQFAQSFENVTTLYPEMRFDEVIKTYGYPFLGKRQADCIEGARKALMNNKYCLRLMQLGISVDDAKRMGLTLPSDEMLARYENACKGSKFTMEYYQPMLFVDFNVTALCCDEIKKKPFYDYTAKSGKYPITAQTAEESDLRENSWLIHGCNAFGAKHPKSNPMSFWLEQDILQYIATRNIQVASVYGNVVCPSGGKLCTTGCSRTGCIFCGFGCHLDRQNGGESRFVQLQRTHPKQYDYCLNGGSYQWDAYIQKNGRWKRFLFKCKDGKFWGDEHIERFVELHSEDKNYKFVKVWKPTKDGLGMKYCIDTLNALYGKNGKLFIDY